MKPCTDVSLYAGQSFNFVPFSMQEVYKALSVLDPRKPSGPDLINPYFFKLAVDFVAEPLTYTYSLKFQGMEICFCSPLTERR